MDKVLNDIQVLKKSQTLSEDMGYGALSAGLIALSGMLYLLVKMSLFNKNLKGFTTRNKNETARVL